MIKPPKEAPANDLDRSVDDGSASRGSNGGPSTVPGCNGPAEARAVQLQVQGCGGSIERSNKSIGSKTESVDSYPTPSSTRGDKPKAHRTVLSGSRDGDGEGFWGSPKL